MLRLRLIFAIALPFSTFLSGCAAHMAQTPSNTIQLGRGKSVTILGIGPVYFTKGPPSLMLRYQSSVDFSNLRALHREALEIWKSFRPVVERNGYKEAVLSANSPPSGVLITSSRGYNFTFELRGHVWYETGATIK